MKLVSIYIVVFFAVAHKACGCIFTPDSANSATDMAAAKLSCLSVKEASQIGNSTCSFLLEQADLTPTLSGELSNFNILTVVSFSENSSIVHLVMTKTYSEIVDRKDINIVPEGVISCKPIDSQEISNFTLIVKIFEENNQAPIFSASMYTYNVPEGMPLNEDFTLFGLSVTAIDRDNAEEIKHPSNTIVYELLEDYDTFKVDQTQNGQVYPIPYRASIQLIQTLNNSATPSYSLTLKAKNADNDPTQVNTTIVTINVVRKTPEPAEHMTFSKNHYRAVVKQAMLHATGTYPIEFDEIKVQDTGDKVPVIYSINSNNCGETRNCKLVRINFKMEQHTGKLLFINTGDKQESLPPQITFEISDGLLHMNAESIQTAFIKYAATSSVAATSVNNPERKAHSTVTVLFDLQ